MTKSKYKDSRSNQSYVVDMCRLSALERYFPFKGYRTFYSHNVQCYAWRNATYDAYAARRLDAEVRARCASRSKRTPQHQVPHTFSGRNLPHWGSSFPLESLRDAYWVLEFWLCSAIKSLSPL